MLTMTHVAAQLFELGANSGEHPEYPCRQICRPIRIRNAPDTESIDAWTISVTPDTLESDCRTALPPGSQIQVALADDEEGWCPAVVQYCEGTPFGYVVGLLCQPAS